MVKKSDTEKYVYGGYGITFGIADSWSFGNSFARNVKIFDVDDSSPSYSDNRKNKFLTLCVILVLMEGLDHQEKSLVLISLKITQNFVLSFRLFVC